MGETESIRLDKWLWAARFFKTRKLAADAIAGGKVHVNGQRCKAGKEIRVGCQLAISKDQYRWNITVLALNAQRRPASEAARLYEESPESHANRQQQIAQQREEGALYDHDNGGRPTKKQRRQIHHFKRME
ncbi:MAG: RNA-binding S4 domain-containing protein [Gammaproteobacteria bacterium]